MDDESIDKFMRPKDIASFKAVAMIQKVYILVRRTNRLSIRWIGQPNYMAKPIDCKPKTADADIAGRAAGLNDLACGGLVIDPTLPGMERAFKSRRKAEKAAACWQAFTQSHGVGRCEARNGQEVRVWRGGYNGGWAVQMCKTSRHYGCLMYSPTPQAVNGKYVHGDYDLFGIVSADAPTEVLRTSSPEENRLMGAPHLRGPNTRNVQFAVNAMSGLALVKHGEQELFADFDPDDKLDIFCPDGSIRAGKSEPEARDFYKNELKGRQVFTSADASGDVSAWGLWRRQSA
jgi:hypothetical protein